MTWFSSPSTTSKCCPYSQTSSKIDLKFFSHKDLIDLSKLASMLTSLQPMSYQISYLLPYKGMYSFESKGMNERTLVLCSPLVESSGSKETLPCLNKQNRCRWPKWQKVNISATGAHLRIFSHCIQLQKKASSHPLLTEHPTTQRRTHAYISLQLSSLEIVLRLTKR